MEWFKIYKMPDGKPANEFAFDAKPKVNAAVSNNCFVRLPVHLLGVRSNYAYTIYIVRSR